MSSSGSSAAPTKPATADLLDLVFNGDTSNPTTLPEAQYLPALQRQAELERQLAEQQERLRLLQAQAQVQSGQSQLVPPYAQGANGFPMAMQPGFGGTGMNSAVYTTTDLLGVGAPVLGSMPGAMSGGLGIGMGAPQMGYPAMPPASMIMQPGGPMQGTHQQWQQQTQHQATTIQPPFVGMMMGPPSSANGMGMGIPMAPMAPMAPMNNATIPGMMRNMPYSATAYATHPMTASAPLDYQEDLPSHPPPPPPSM